MTEDKRAYTWGSGLKREAINRMCICLSGGAEKHHTAGTTVVILCDRYAENVAEASTSIPRSAGSRSVRRVEAIPTVQEKNISVTLTTFI